MTLLLSRRATLLGLTTVLASARASLALAAADTDRRFVVIILRGALDGLSAVQPYADPDVRPLRGHLALPEPGQADGLLDLGGRFGLHPSLARLHAMYRANEVAILHAVAGPYRERSHFKAQDMLESGTDHRTEDGWLNRAVAAIPRNAGPASRHNPLSVGVSVPLLLRGRVPTESWAPSNLATPQADLYSAILGLHAADPLTGPALRTGLASRGFSREVLTGSDAEARAGDFPSLARAGGKLLAAANGPRVAALELGGWDTHAGQLARLKATLHVLDEGLAALRESLGEAWKSTAVLVMTEFGRTVRANGTGGTDHGTGTVAFVLGGAVAGGRVVTDWPGLGSGRLLEDRDLMPTLDLRAVSKALVAEQLRVPASGLDSVFPDSSAVSPVRGLLRA